MVTGWGETNNKSIFKSSDKLQIYTLGGTNTRELLLAPKKTLALLTYSAEDLT